MRTLDTSKTLSLVKSNSVVDSAFPMSREQVVSILNSDPLTRAQDQSISTFRASKPIYITCRAFSKRMTLCVWPKVRLTHSHWPLSVFLASASLGLRRGSRFIVVALTITRSSMSFVTETNRAEISVHFWLGKSGLGRFTCPMGRMSIQCWSRKDQNG